MSRENYHDFLFCLQCGVLCSITILAFIIVESLRNRHRKYCKRGRWHDKTKITTFDVDHWASRKTHCQRNTEQKPFHNICNRWLKKMMILLPLFPQQSLTQGAYTFSLNSQIISKMWISSDINGWLENMVAMGTATRRLLWCGNYQSHWSGLAKAVNKTHYGKPLSSVLISVLTKLLLYVELCIAISQTSFTSQTTANSVFSNLHVA